MKTRSLLTSALALGLALCPASAALAQAPQHFVAETPTARVDYWQVRAADIARQLATPESLKPIRLVFVGDSITDFWHLDANPWFPGKFCGRAVWDETFGGTNPAWAALNLGVSGDRIEHVLHRLQPAEQGGEGWLDRADLQPDRVFVLLGINNSFDAEKPAVESIVRGVSATLARIRERKPNAQIVVQSLLPTDDPAKNRDLVQPVNAALVAIAANGANMRYLDLYSGFVDAAGTQRRELFNDSLHPSQTGYRVWRDRVVAFLKAD
ncbi:GDSL-type esterase/lipase family protein [Novosphingobium sp.]|uniref:GDSL-type esterase/lipase family protein n=1 Tax=Novosphingobium sp. TaxID=1874826 RepID=UPI003BAAA567